MRHYYKHMKYKYGEHTCMNLKHYSKQKQKLTRLTAQLKFFLECRKYDIIPNHLTNAATRITIETTSPNIKQQIEKAKRLFLKKLLNIEITQTNINIKSTRDQMGYTERQLKRNLSEIDLNSFFSDQTLLSQRVAKEQETIQAQKLERLKYKQLQNLGICVNSDWFINKTNIHFPEEVKWLLSLGRKFTIPTTSTSLQPIKIIAEMEQIIHQIEDERTKEMERSRLSNRILQYKRQSKHNPVEKFILHTFDKTKAFLQKHKEDIIITDSDKGNKTVAIYKTDYREKMNSLLGDKNTYRIARNDPTNALQKQNNKLVGELYKNKNINIKEKKQLTCTAATAPRLYGLPKIHKPNLPLRPIASSVSVPCYGLSKFIGKFLGDLTSEEYNIRNSLRLKERLEKVRICEEDLLVSFDVVSLFTNIPTYLAIKIIMSKFSQIMSRTNIPKNKFLDLLNFCLKDNNYFMYDGKIYTQSFGMPMGNPLSPTIADIIMDDLLDNTISELKKLHNIDIKFIVKYVDDIFAIVKRNDVDIILKTLNRYHNKLQFTIEREENFKIPFLDVLIHRKNDEILLDWYSKPISSGRIINFLSSQPMKYKINAAKNLLNKILTISHKQFLDENTKKIYKILTNNNYPSHLIKTLIEQKLTEVNNKENKITPTATTTETKQYFSVTYIPKLTDKFNHNINEHKKNITLAYKSNCTLSTIFTKTKSPIETYQQSNVVYEVKCMGGENVDCNKIYIGTTKRTLGIRLPEHEADIRKEKKNTALAQHMLENSHTADLANARIIDVEKRERTRYTLESLRILENRKRTMNTKEDTDDIAATYLLCL
ncbi:PREDICTED: uncharacterized protein LOC108368252 [Rhagoletis zephyria]|uniref:uncharacterized protein LOC108368252 n=1 Tax=Rhagoletis zephyria TaxID=28612 RepID=UPI0008113E27|nr:PREDICTED: uncharacterized protein LOC108368252 [Rhagoletis zephyria]